MNVVLGLIILAVSVYAIYRVIASGAGTGAKVLWILLIVILPVIGVIAWAIAGPR